MRALRKLGWGAPSSDTVKTRDGCILYFGAGPVPEKASRADAAIIRKFVEDDYERMAIKDSLVHRDVNDREGGRGYARAIRGGVEESKAAGLWCRGKFEHENGDMLPWIWPAKIVVRNAHRAGRHKAAACLRSLVEGGWRTQKKLYAEGRASHDRCACGEMGGGIWHKLGLCQLTEDHRRQHCPPWLL